MKLRRLLACVMAVVLLACSLSFVASAYDTELASTGYYNESKYETEAAAAYNVKDLGSTYTKTATTWKMWSPAASKVQVRLFETGTDNESGAGVIGTYNLSKDSKTCVWSLTKTGDYKDKYYTYLVTIDGKVNETQDPYSMAVGANGNRSMVVDLDSTDPDGWSEDKHVLFDSPTQAAVMEIHVRDFSIDVSSGVSDENKGKFMAFTEGDTTVNKEGKIKTCVDYLVEHNINCVQLMPVADMDSVDETSTAVQRNWGYDVKNFFVPEGSYSTDPYDGNIRIKEYKMLIQALHDRGIAVIMDVVYNHTFVREGSPLNLTTPDYYYRMKGAGKYYDGSGLGNVLASDKKMCQKIIKESLLSWVNEYHVDGFRFDIMGCIDSGSMTVIRQAMDSVDKRIILYGEPWIGNEPSHPKEINASNLYKLDRVGGFNEAYSDGLKGSHKSDSTGDFQNKGFVEGGTDSTSANNALKGVSSSLVNCKPNQEVNYTSNHDNLNLLDKILAANGKIQGGKDGKTLSGADLIKTNKTAVKNPDATSIKQVKLALTSSMTSQGIPFSLQGDEMCRTKYGDANSYRTPDAINAVDWTQLKNSSMKGVADYYTGLAAIRQAYSGFTSSTAKSVTTVSGVAAGAQFTNSKSGEWNKVIVALNNTSGSKNITLSGSWDVIADGTTAGTKSLKTVSSSYSVPAYSGVILVDHSSFDNYKQPSRAESKLIVEHYTRENEAGSYSKVKTETAVYQAGMTYRASKDLSILFDHNFDKFESSTSKTYGTAPDSSQTITVKFYYTRYIKSNYLTVNFLNTNDPSKTVRSPMVYRLKDGVSLSVPVPYVIGCELDSSKYPQGTYGTFDASKPLTINFYFKPLTTSVSRVHYKKTNSWTGLIQLYAYYTDGNGKNVEPVGPWTSKEHSKMTQEGNGWWVLDVPAAACYVMFHSSMTNDQEPGAGESGYLVSGESWVENGTVKMSSRIVVSHINIHTGKRLADDEVTVKTGVYSTQSYTTAPKSNLGTYLAPANANGFYQAGTINVVYLYDPGQKPTTPTSTVTGGIYGDVDQDGQVLVTDATLVQKYVAKMITLDDTQLAAADVNADKKVDIQDATYIQKYCAKMKVEDSRCGDPMGDTPQPGKHTRDEFIAKYNELKDYFDSLDYNKYRTRTEYQVASDTLDEYASIIQNPSASSGEIDNGYEACQSALDGLKNMPTEDPTPTTPPGPGNVIYCSPFDQWFSDGAITAAYFWGDGDYHEWRKMEPIMDKYYCDIPDGCSNVLFARINPNAQLEWDSWDPNVVWNQTDDTYVQQGGTFVIDGWGEGGKLPGHWE